MDRRTFLKLSAGISAAVGLSPLAFGESPAIPIIDTHIHLFDPTRPQGVPWPPKDDTALYRPALPARYRSIAVPLGIVGAIEIEASAWLEDNQWVLDTAAKDKIIVGTIGNLEPGKPEFRKQLERFHRNPLFRGIRYGNLWDRDLGRELSKPAFVSDLRALADAHLALDTANPNMQLLADAIRVTDQVPGLRVIVDHLPQIEISDNPESRKAFTATLHELAARPQVYIKISEVLRLVNGRVPVELSFYRDRLDELTGIFSEDRVLYGSDWPNCDHWGSYETVFHLVREYFAGKSRAAAEKYFWKNSVAAYRWVKRDASQPSLRS